jgi:hypothetical protein
MQVVLAIPPGPDQRRRIDYIRDRMTACFSRHSVTIEETRAYRTAHVTVLVDPDPPVGDNLLTRCAYFGNDAKCIIYSDWPEPRRCRRRSPRRSWKRQP